MHKDKAEELQVTAFQATLENRIGFKTVFQENPHLAFCKQIISLRPFVSTSASEKMRTFY